MPFKWHFAVYDILALQMQVSVLISLLFWLNALNPLSEPLSFLNVTCAGFISSLLCMLLILMFFLIDVIVLPPTFAFVQFVVSRWEHTSNALNTL